jgi:hypothetical protein
VTLLLVGRPIGGHSQTPDGALISKEAILQQTAANVIQSSYEDLASKCGELKQQIDGLAAARTRAALARAQEAWTAAMLAARKIQACKAGPLAEREYASTFYYWQVLPVRVESVLASTRALDESYLDELGATTKGLFALEYLLFERAPNSSSANTNAAPPEPELLAGTNAPRRCQFLGALARNVLARATALADDWRKSGGQSARTRFAAGGQQTVNLLVNQLAADLENIAEDHLHLLLQLPNPIARQLDRIEGSRSGTSLKALLARLAGIRELYCGGAGPGLDDYLRSLNQPLAQRVEEKFAAAVTQSQAIGSPLEEAMMTSHRGSVERAYEAVRDLELLFKVDLASALGVTITFNSNDGD